MTSNTFKTRSKRLGLLFFVRLPLPCDSLAVRQVFLCGPLDQHAVRFQLQLVFLLSTPAGLRGICRRWLSACRRLTDGSGCVARTARTR
jgi:hypothetical protein